MPQAARSRVRALGHMATAEGTRGSTAEVLLLQPHLKEANGCVLEVGESGAAHADLGVHCHVLETHLNFAALDASPAHATRDVLCILL